MILHEPLKRSPISKIKKDKLEILEQHNKKESMRFHGERFYHMTDRDYALYTIRHLIDEWGMKIDELFMFDGLSQWGNGSLPYVPEYSEEALNYSIKVHDALGLDYKCKECLVRAACCRYSNVENLELNNICDGVSQLLSAKIIYDINYYYLNTKKD